MTCLTEVLTLFDIQPDYDLDLMQWPVIDGIDDRVLHGMENVLAEEKPDLVFVHGDTTTSSATALAAFYAQADIAHIEAGLRTHDLSAPWPEEANRQITGRLTKWHFAPTDKAKQNLLAENVPDERICVTGNTVIDALHHVRDAMRADDAKDAQISAALAVAGFQHDPTRRVILVTAHRRENFGQGFQNICAALAALAEANADCDIVYPCI